MKITSMIKNAAYSIVTSLFTFLISAVFGFAVPKIIPVADYGYWQYFVMLTAYYGLFHFGLISGLYLKNGGKEYTALDKSEYTSQFFSLLIIETAVSVLMCIMSLIFVKDTQKQLIFISFGIATFFSNIKQFFLYAYLATNCIKKYAFITLAERCVFLFLSISFILVGTTSYRPFVLCEIISQVFGAVFCVVAAKSLFIFVKPNIKRFFLDTSDNIKIGLKVTIADVAAMLLLTVTRLFIEYSWNIETYSAVSLALSVSGIATVLVSAVGIVVFPLLKKADQKSQTGLYDFIRTVIMGLFWGCLVFYYPLRLLVGAWLPQYADSLKYMVFFLPLCVYNGKYYLLLSTYFKALRLEKSMMIIDISFFVLHIILTALCVVIYGSLSWTIIVLLLVVISKNIVCEYLFHKAIGTHFLFSLLSDILLTLFFIISAWYIQSWICFAIYLTIYSAYAFSVLKSKFGKLNIASSKYLRADLRYTPESCFYAVLKYQLIRLCLLRYYRKTSDLEANDVVLYLKSHKAPAFFPYAFTDKYNDIPIDVYKDASNELFYVIRNQKRLYFKRSLTSEQSVMEYYRQILLEQDDCSPHKYVFSNRTLTASDTIFDIGAAEGFFALDNIDSLESAYLFECDKEWVEALRYTFAPYSTKAHIIQKYVSDVSDDASIALDDFVSEKGLLNRVSIIKMDIEGAETDALNGAKLLIENRRDICWLICTYHNQYAKEEVSAFFRNVSITPSPGYMLFFSDFNLCKPYLRRGLLRIEPIREDVPQ